MPKPADWWVEYYDPVGEHGGFKAHGHDHAVREGVRLAREAKRKPNQTWMVEIMDYNHNVGEVFWATREYIGVVQSRDPEGNPPEWIDALKKFVRTGRRAPYDLNKKRAETARRNPTWTVGERQSRLMEFVDVLSRNEWGQRVDDMNPHEIQELEDAASSLAQIAAELGFYLMMRGAAGAGDHGHDKAFEYARKRLKAVRKALGYSYP